MGGLDVEKIHKYIYYQLLRLSDESYKKKNCEISKRFRENNRDKIKKEKRDWKTKQRNALTDYYIASVLCLKSKLKAKDIRENRSLIEAQRIKLKINRIIKNQ